MNTRTVTRTFVFVALMLALGVGTSFVVGCRRHQPVRRHPRVLHVVTNQSVVR